MDINIKEIDLANGATETLSETWAVGPVPEFETGELFAAAHGTRLYAQIKAVAIYNAKFATWYPGSEAEWALSRGQGVLSYHAEEKNENA